MNKKAFYILAAVSLMFVVSCKKQAPATAQNNDYKKLEKKIDLIEKRQEEILSQLKYLNLKGRGYSRFVKSMLKDKESALVKIGDLRKEVRKIRINNSDFARIVNKLIDINTKQKVEMTKLKRQFYTLWAIAKKKGDVPKVAKKRTTEVKKKVYKKPVIEDEKTRRQKNRMLKVLEGRT